MTIIEAMEFVERMRDSGATNIMIDNPTLGRITIQFPDGNDKALYAGVSAAPGEKREDYGMNPFVEKSATEVRGPRQTDIDILRSGTERDWVSPDGNAETPTEE